MRFERTRDRALIRSILTHPSIWPHIGDDFAGRPEEFRVNEDPRIWYVAAYDGDELLGLFLFLGQSTVLWEMHVSMLPAARGARSRAAGREVIGWLFEHTSCRRLVGQVSLTNPRALGWVRAIGLTDYGINEKSFLKGGELHDQVCVGISAKDLKCHLL